MNGGCMVNTVQFPAHKFRLSLLKSCSPSLPQTLKVSSCLMMTTYHTHPLLRFLWSLSSMSAHTIFVTTAIKLFRWTQFLFLGYALGANILN